MGSLIIHNNFGSVINADNVTINNGEIKSSQRKPETPTDIEEVACVSTENPVQSSGAKKRGPREKSLFINETIAVQEKKRFMDFLHLHNLGQNDFDSSEDNSGSQIAVCFFRQWQRRKLLNHKVNGTALMRFMKDECALSITVDEKAYGNALAKMIGSEKIYSDWCGEVGTYFNS